MTGRPVRVAINGFGRIGRTLMRLILSEARDIELVLVNDIAEPDLMAYLFGYDSVFGPWPEPVTARNGALQAGRHSIPLHQAEDLRALDLSGVDVVLECTGLATSRPVAEAGLDAGARRVLISGPSPAADVTLVLGANDERLAGQPVVSNASCTTNALAPLLRLLDASWGVESGQMTTVHCYTGSQPTVDKPRGTPERSRAAALSMVPTTTSAGALIGEVLPSLRGRVEARALRVPTASVSSIDLTVRLRRPAPPEDVNAALRDAAEGSDVFGWIEVPLVSTDLRGRCESIIMSGPGTSVAGDLTRLFGWYDNEWGFSCRMLDMARRMAAEG
ncbi:type I glyceraldehyde-3-phosphate dehydrogenase [Rhodosalinus sp. FB01]|uniref:type I glyceraldehyde-3-phosphate dehydrogenase n=1 Tax=Rhodosalinus sp. FB01 TaxID=3239194 RepID=UPI003525BB84